MQVSTMNGRDTINKFIKLNMVSTKDEVNIRMFKLSCDQRNIMGSQFQLRFHYREQIFLV